MSVEIVVPTLGESVTEATVSQWLKKVGDRVERDEPLVELETDKVTLEINAAEAGTLSEIRVESGGNVAVGAVLGTIGAASEATAAKASGAGGTTGSGNGRAAPGAKPGPEAAAFPETPRPPEGSPAEPAEGVAAAATAAQTPYPVHIQERPAGEQTAPVMPAARKMIEESGLDAKAIAGTGKDGRITKGDVAAHLDLQGRPSPTPATAGATQAEPRPAPAPQAAAAPQAAPASQAMPPPRAEAPSAPAQPAAERPKAAREERVRMTKLRQTIAQRLKQAQSTAAILTTFNEVDMTNLLAVRNDYKAGFEKKHGVKLGFMSFFVKACIAALKEIPAVNAEIDGTDIVYKNHYDIGVAVSSPSGLVVPVVRDADALGFAEIEKTIAGLADKARDGRLTVADLTGGTFTVSNGGVFGSLLSTPILNPPQSAILGMHKTQDRPMAVGGKVEVRPMMYLALSYDHRIIDGREAVTFLVRVKESIEDPRRMLLDV